MTKVALLINEVQLSPNIPQSSSKIQPECLVPAHTAQAYTGQRCHRNFAKVFTTKAPSTIGYYLCGQKYCENFREISLTAVGRTGRAPVVRLA